MLARRLAFSLVVLVGCSARGVAPSPAPPPKSSSPILVTVVVDQMAAWIAHERWPLLPSNGGFARLRREGTWVVDMRYAHAVTDTAPGHAALYTGRAPRDTGVIANVLASPNSGKPEPIYADATTHVVSSRETNEMIATSSSAARLRVDTIADRFRAAHPEARIVSLSLKDRAAIPGGGRRPDASLWFDRDRDAFVTSTAFASSLPTWAMTIGGHDALAKRREKPWDLFDPVWVEAHAASIDRQPGEGDLEGLGVSFPHTATSPTAFRATPEADATIFALALAAIDEPSVRSKPTLLAVSLSANDYIGHTFGPDSWESWDELRRLDDTLARFMNALDTRLGASRWSMIVSADHGVTPMPELWKSLAARPWCEKPDADRWERPCSEPHRLFAGTLETALEAAAVAVVGPGDWIASIADPYVTLTEAAHRLSKTERAKLDGAIDRALSERPGIARVFDVAKLRQATCPPLVDESIDALVCRSISIDDPGDFYVVTTPGSFFDADVVVGKGTGHGSPYRFDRAVPMLVRAPGRIDAGVVLTDPQSFTMFARTAARLLDLSEPAR